MYLMEKLPTWQSEVNRLLVWQKGGFTLIIIIIMFLFLNSRQFSILTGWNVSIDMLWKWWLCPVATACFLKLCYTSQMSCDVCICWNCWMLRHRCTGNLPQRKCQQCSLDCTNRNIILMLYCLPSLKIRSGNKCALTHVMRRISAADEWTNNHGCAVSLAVHWVWWWGYRMDDWRIGVWFRVGADIPALPTVSRSVFRPTRSLVLIGTGSHSLIYALHTCI
jgi:hypothetical protein